MKQVCSFDVVASQVSIPYVVASQVSIPDVVATEVCIPDAVVIEVCIPDAAAIAASQIVRYKPLPDVLYEELALKIVSVLTV